MDNFYLMQNLLLFDSTGYFEIELSKKRLKVEDLFKVNSEKMISQMNLGLFQKKEKKNRRRDFFLYKINERRVILLTRPAATLCVKRFNQTQVKASNVNWKGFT